MAYNMLGRAYDNISQPELGDDYVRKAFELRERASERENFLLSANYYSVVTEQFDKAADVGELWSQSTFSRWRGYEARAVCPEVDTKSVREKV